MKKIYVLLFLLSFHLSYGQDCGIRTPLGSTISTYDWQQERFEFWIRGCGERHPYSPFWSNGNYNPNIRHLYGPPDDDDGSWVRDYRPEDGWELLYKHFGTQSKPVEVPTLMLYNRYESNIRLFFYLTPKGEYGGADIKMWFVGVDKLESALLNYVAQPQKALDDFRKNMVVHMPNEYENGAGGNNCEGYWIFGDIPVAYDPCTCHHSTVLKASPSLVDTATISLDISGGGTITQVATQGNYNYSSHTSVLQNLNGAVATGAKTAKSLQGFYGTIESIASVFDLVDLGNSAYSYNENKAIVADGVSSSDAKDIAQEAIDFVDERKEKAFAFPAWAKQIPKIGVALGILDFVIGGGKSSGGSKPKPTSFEADLNFTATGTIITPSPYTSTRLFVSGSNYPSSAPEEETPVYDNIMGIFTLLETPEVLVDTETETFTQDGAVWVNRLAYFKLASDIKYAINPASGLVLDDIAFRFVAKETSGEMGAFGPETEMDEYSGPNGTFFKSPIIRSGCFENYVMALQATLAHPLIHLPALYLEVNVTLKQNPDLIPPALYDANAEKVFIRHTYKVDQIGGDIVDDFHLGQIKQDVTIDNLSLTEDMIIYAWSTVDITGTITTNGHKLTVIAGNEITGLISDLPDGVDLIIGNPAGCGDVVPAQTAAEINDFCTSSKYNPVAAQPGYPQDGENAQSQESKAYLKVHPNPFQDYFKVTYRLDEGKEIMGFLRNALGQTVKEIRLEGGANEKELIVDSGDLPTGIYFLSIQTEFDLKTVKLMKQVE